MTEEVSSMAQSNSHEAESSPKDRILRLFKFLYEVNRLRNRPERTLDEQVSSIPLTHLPEHPSIQMLRPVATEGEPPGGFELKVARATTTRCPDPPAVLGDWLISGWDDPTKEPSFSESLNRKNEKGESVTISFAADPQRTGAWAQWTSTRKAWAEPECRARNALGFFEKLYGLYALLQKDGEQLELIVADGILNWRVRSVMELVEVRLHHPLLLKRVELTFDASKPEFRVTDAERDSELYTSLLIDLDGLNAAGIDARQRELSSAKYHPMGFADTQAFLKALVQTISPTTGQYFEDSRGGYEPHPRLWREPMLLVRRRVQGVTNAILRIIDDIKRKEVFPPAFGQIVGMATEWKTAAESEATDDGRNSLGGSAAFQPTSIVDDEILLAKEANEEQMQIIRRLSASGSVLVQGPPGTGKTHTIGNIIGHLLAQGKTVLVTSHTPKALRVLRDQIPHELKPLCVSAVGGDRESRRQLEAAITEINARLARKPIETLRLEIEQRLKERRRLLEENRLLTTKLREALESEYREIATRDSLVTPTDAARYVRKHTSVNSWIPGPLAERVSPPLSVEELSTLYSTNADFSASEEHDASYRLPPVDGLMPVEDFQCLIADIGNLVSSDTAFKSELWRGGAGSCEDLSRLLEELAREFSPDYRRLTWRPHAIVAGIRGGTQRQVWQALITKILKASELSGQYSLMLHHRAKLSTEIPTIKQCEIFEEILAYLGRGKKLGLVQLVIRAEWRQAIKTSTVAAGRPERKEHFQALRLLANLETLRLEIQDLWDNLVARNGGKRFDELGPEPEQSARPMLEEIRRCLDWHRTVWLPIVERIKACGLDYEKALASTPREAGPVAEYEGAEKAAVQVLPPILEAQVRRIRLKECEAELARQIDVLMHYEQCGCDSHLLEAIRQKDVQAYRRAYDYNRRLHEISPKVICRQQLLKKLAEAAAEWASAIAHRRPPHDGPSPPGDPAEAWKWRQLAEELERRHLLDPQALQGEIEKTRKLLREVTLSLIELRAWVSQLERVRNNHSVRQALVGWLDTIKKLKSTQKKDLVWRLQAEARNLMKLSAKAVPVWIMPLSVAAENFDPVATRFDVVIIDEASQADLNALVAIYQADKVIIVGDHEQVTPEAVGKDQTLVHNLIDTHIRDIPNSRLFDNRFSIYDIGRQSFGDAICLLEHFRCVPEIIAFSNKLSYDGRIKALRESNSTPIKPACVAYPVNGVAQNQVNQKEADTIVDLIKAMCRHPRYSGKTIGVISMVGESQANLIDARLRRELDPIEYERRRIVCGNSAQFQGDERNVMLLSMIDSGKEFGLGPIAKKGEGAWESIKKRYNVAASRAQDQMWIIHSLDPSHDLKPDDLRLELILHAQNPSSTIRLFKQEAPRTESEFERQVLRILVNKGFKVRCQWSVGYYRIDMVIEGEGKRLALECDGDRWHPIEKLADDMARQAVLERLGWKFVRIRGSAFFRNEEEAMHPVFERLGELGIAPGLRDEVSIEDDSLTKELEAIVAEFHAEEGVPPSVASVAETVETVSVATEQERLIEIDQHQLSFPMAQHSVPPILPGSRVSHLRFGRGTVIEREGDGDEAKLTVRFDAFGLRKLVAGHARLVIVQ
ncbi:MAG TPA: AAA domain-containing protein [Terriglobales bacterium]|nr:AAA domain-containing protein [Terriglobales bacterium]